MPNNRELEIINSSGDLTEIKLGGADDEKVVLTKEQVEALFGNWQFEGNQLKVNNKRALDELGTLLQVGVDFAGLFLNGTSITFPNLSIALIDAGDGKSAVTKEWTEGKFNAKADGASGSFTAQSGETVTVVDGLITSIS